MAQRKQNASGKKSLKWGKKKGKTKWKIRKTYTTPIYKYYSTKYYSSATNSV